MAAREEIVGGERHRQTDRDRNEETEIETERQRQYARNYLTKP